MLTDWKAYAGIIQNGPRKGQPMSLVKVQKNSLCVLTTRNINTKEKSRYIFAVFLVDCFYEGGDFKEGYVGAHEKYRIKLSSAEAIKLKFWNYYKNQNSPSDVRWSSGLHRYINDEQSLQILKDIYLLKKGTKDEILAQEFMDYFAMVNNLSTENIKEKSGALII